MKTIEELKDSQKPFFTAADIAPIIGSDAHAIRLEARRVPCRLGFPFLMIGNRLKIPAAGFIAWYEGRAGRWA